MKIFRFLRSNFILKGMRRFLPMFPLNLVVFPGERLNLHIFEPRYRELIKDCKEDGITFGIPPFIEGKMMPRGTELGLISIEKTYPDGKMDVRTEAFRIFEIQSFERNVEGKLYSGAFIDEVAFNEDDGSLDQKKQILDQLKLLFQIMKINKGIPENYEYIKTFKIAHNCGLNMAQKYELLQINSEFDRELYLINHFNKLIPILREMEMMRQRIQMNGHFKNIVPPQF